MIGSSGRASDDHALPYTECACAAATTSGCAWCTAEWMTKPAWFTGLVPCTMSPSWFTAMRSETRMCRKLIPNGLTQNMCGSSGSRTVMWPAIPSPNPKRPKMRNAPASCCLRCSRSSALVAKVGGCGIVMPSCEGLNADISFSVLRSCVGAAMPSTVRRVPGPGQEADACRRLMNGSRFPT